MKLGDDGEFARRYGRWAVVTGASSGIGRACAVELAARGLDLVLVARREQELRLLCGELEASGVQTRALVLDLASRDGQSDLETFTQSLDVGLVVAAAGFGRAGRLIDGTLDEDNAMLEVNMRAVLRQCHHFGRRFAERGRGGLVLFGSLVGFQGAPWAAQYAATKAYVQSLGEGLAAELRPQGVDVLVVAPGPVHSGFADRARMTLGPADRPPAVARSIVRALGRRSTVTPGVVGKFLTWSLSTAPRGLRTRIMGTIMRGMTRRSAGG